MQLKVLVTVGGGGGVVKVNVRKCLLVYCSIYYMYVSVSKCFVKGRLIYDWRNISCWKKVIFFGNMFRGCKSYLRRENGSRWRKMFRSRNADMKYILA